MSTQLQKDTFNAILPIEIIKSKDKSGKSLMRMRGKASSTTQDSDGEFLNPKGFKSDYFLTRGYMNWNHQVNKDPSAIVGRPVDAKVVGNDYIIEYNLFPKSEKARQIYELQEVLESEGLALGLSIEGKVLRRDPNDNRKVLEAEITGCAITPAPKNEDTVTEIIKSRNFNELSAYENEDDETKQKAMTAGSSSGRALALESVDQGVKYQEYKKSLNKGMVFQKLLRALPSHSPQQIAGAFDFLENLEKMKTNTKSVIEISNETIEKGLAIIKASTAPEDAIEKGENGEDLELDQDELLKSRDNLLDALEQVEDAIEKARCGTMKKMNDYEQENDDEEDEENEGDEGETKSKGKMKKGEGKMKKGEDDNDLDSQIIDQTGVDVDALTKGIADEIAASFETKFAEIGKVTEALNAKIDEVGNMTAGRKSITTRAYLTKGETGQDDKTDPTKTYHIVHDRQRLSTDLTDLVIKAEDADNRFSKAVLTYDQAGTISPALVQLAKDNGLTLING